MLENQLSRYKDAVGKSNIASKINSNELPNVTKGLKRNRSFSLVKEVSTDAADAMMAARGPKSLGSAAGYRGGNTVHLGINGSGYYAASRKTSAVSRLPTHSAAIIPGKKVNSYVTKGVESGSRLMSNSKSRLSKIMSLSRLA